MRSFLPALLRVSLIAAAAASFSAAAQQAPVVLATTEEQPTAYRIDGVLTGFLVDLTRDAFKRSGRTGRIETLPWARAISEARSGAVDGVLMLYNTPERRPYLDFSEEPILIQDQGLYVRASALPGFGPDMASLTGKKIGVMSKISYGERFDTLLAQGFFTHIDTQANLETLVKMLAGGRVDVVPAYRGTMRRTVREMGLAGQIVELPVPMEALPSYVGFTRERDLAAVRHDFDVGLRAMKADGSYDMLLKRYFSQTP